VRWNTSSTPVLYFEGERHHNHRIVRATKNRFRRCK
jgi:predicted ATP-dependent serine protease